MATKRDKPTGGSPASDHEHRHTHPDLRAELRGAIRALIVAVEAGGSYNSEQQKALHAVRVIIGDAHGRDCPHELAVYEEGDVLVCQDCRAEVG